MPSALQVGDGLGFKDGALVSDVNGADCCCGERPNDPPGCWIRARACACNPFAPAVSVPCAFFTPTGPFSDLFTFKELAYCYQVAPNMPRSRILVGTEVIPHNIFPNCSVCCGCAHCQGSHSTFCGQSCPGTLLMSVSGFLSNLSNNPAICCTNNGSFSVPVVRSGISCQWYTQQAPIVPGLPDPPPPSGAAGWARVPCGQCAIFVAATVGCQVAGGWRATVNAQYYYNHCLIQPQQCQPNGPIPNPACLPCQSSSGASGGIWTHPNVPGCTCPPAGGWQHISPPPDASLTVG